MILAGNEDELSTIRALVDAGIDDTAAIIHSMRVFGVHFVLLEDEVQEEVQESQEEPEKMEEADVA